MDTLFSGDSFFKPSLGIPVAAFAAWILYVIWLAAYRLYFSPLSQFPGPRLAALSRWYEAYYEIVLSGQYSRKIDALHDIYGPIIRVAPDELHIRDSHYFDQLYANNLKIDKPGWDKRFGVEETTFTTADSVLHRRRRGALSPMFSRRSILAFEPVVRQRAELMCQRIAEFKDSPTKPLVISHVYPAFTGDIIMEYAFGFSYNQLESPKFDSFHDALIEMGGFGHIAAQFPWFLALMHSVPDRFIEKIQPATASLLRLKKDLWDLVGQEIQAKKKAKERRPTDQKTSSHPTIFHEILRNTGLPPEDKTQQRLADEAQIVLAAGVETTAFALSVGTFHIVNTPRIYQRLHHELVQAFPDDKTTTTTTNLLLELEKLPYLRGCIQESLRLSYGISARNPRRHDRPLQYGKQWTIPAGTTVAMTGVDVHHDENLFPESHAFVPERWLDDPRTAADGTPLEHYLVAFGRGTRVCLGMNLAWAELYLAMGMIFRRFEFTLYETDISDVEMKYDFFTPRPKFDSKGVRVLVSEVSR